MTKKTIYILSNAYFQKGHSKEYIDNFRANLESKYKIIQFVNSVESSKCNFEHITVDCEVQNFDEIRFKKYGVLRRPLRTIVKLLYGIKFYKSLPTNLISTENDIVYIMDYEYFSVLYLLLKLNRSNVKFMFWLHSANTSGSLIYKSYKTISINILKRLIGNNKLIVNGQKIKSTLTKKFKFNQDIIKVVQYVSETKMKFTPISKKSARSQLNLPQENHILLSFGMLRADKDIETTIRSVAHYNSNNQRQAMLVIAGSEAGVSQQEIESWISKYKLEMNELIIKYITEQEMHLLYSSADALIMTYRGSSMSQSGPASFARNYKLPVISTNVGEIGSYIIDNKVGFVSSSDKIENISATIAGFVNLSAAELSSLEKNIEDVQAKFSWTAATDIYITTIENI